MSRPAGKVLWISVLATVAVYLVMVLWSLPRIAEAAGGLRPFDMRPLGYGEDDARRFLMALGDGGRRFYLDVQHRLDLVYPVLLAVTVVLAARRLFPPGAARTVIGLCAVAGMACDYAENRLAGMMLALPADAVSADTIAWASRATLGKSLLTSLALTGILAGIVLGLSRRWRQG